MFYIIAIVAYFVAASWGTLLDHFQNLLYLFFF